MKASTRTPRASARLSPTPDQYRNGWQWERATWGTHCVDCYPGNCAFRVYVKDGRILREEQSGTYRTIEEGVPDMNPMGCQKGVIWGTRTNARDRILYPMRRVGERGKGKWRRITWDIALKQVANAILDAIEEAGTASIIHETAPAQGGLMAVVAPARFNQLIAGTTGVEEPEALLRRWIDDSATAGNVPEGTTLDTLREDGHVRLTNWGLSVLGMAQSSDLKQDETHSPYRWHIEKKLPYPTLTRRAQFYIDHEWFLRAGEGLPAHKDNPRMGGDYPLELTSGHNRWSIHSQNVADPVLLQTHRGCPSVWMSPPDAAARGIEDGDEVRAFNDAGEFIAPVKLAPSVRPGQVVMYNGWEPYQFRNWRDPSHVEPGMVKPLHLAAGYGHLTYHVGAWQIVTVDRGTRLEVERWVSSG